MKFSVKQLKPFVKTAVNNYKEEIISRLIAELEEAYKYSDIVNEDEMHDILFEEPDFILDHFVDSGIISEIIDTMSEDEIAEIISYWQQEKIDMLLEDFNELPRPLRKMLQGFM